MSQQAILGKLLCYKRCTYEESQFPINMIRRALKDSPDRRPVLILYMHLYLRQKFNDR